MNANGKSTMVSEIPSGVLALLILVFGTIVIFAVGETNILGSSSSDISYVLNALIIAAGCFFIIRMNPKSLWYVPLIANLLLIIAAIAEPNFWKTPMWILVCGGWVLCLASSIAGARLGRSEALQSTAGK